MTTSCPGFAEPEVYSTGETIRKKDANFIRKFKIGLKVDFFFFVFCLFVVVVVVVAISWAVENETQNHRK